MYAVGDESIRETRLEIGSYGAQPTPGHAYPTLWLRRKVLLGAGQFKATGNKSDAASLGATCSLAKQLGMIHNAIFRIWRTLGLKPHRVRRFNISTDPEFIEKASDAVELYFNAPEAALVPCLDEKTQIQALDRT